MNKGVTVLVCMFNAASRLPKTIEHLALQTATQKINWEIIVVDNASTDGSAQVARNEWAKYTVDQVGFTVLTEKNPGKIYALEQGVAAAKFEYCLICDDDNWLDPEYVEKVYAILEAHPEVGAVGGQGIAVTDIGGLPEWFKDYEEGYATGKQGKQTGYVTSNGHLWGAGLGTRKSLYQEMYKDFPSLLTGRLGKQLTAGEDAEYCQRLILKGYQLYYDETLVFEHYMPLNRLNTEYRINLFDGFVESNKVLHKYYLANSIKQKCEGHIFTKSRLLLITPFRLLFARTAQQKEKEMDTLTLVSPVNFRSDTVISKIKQFYTH